MKFEIDSERAGQTAGWLAWSCTHRGLSALLTVHLAAIRDLNVCRLSAELPPVLVGLAPAGSPQASR